MTKLHRVSTGEKSDYQADVVFVHGLGGHFAETWGSESLENCWLSWLAADLPTLCIWTLEYEASPSDWFKTSSMPLGDRAGNVANRMIVQKFGKRPLVFIGHSLGGLVIKQLLRHLFDNQRDSKRKQLLSQTKAVAFLATPHTGADLANWLSRLDIVLRAAPAAHDLTANNRVLRDLNLWYREHAGRLSIATLCYMEGKNQKYSGSRGLFGRSRYDQRASNQDRGRPLWYL